MPFETSWKNLYDSEFNAMTKEGFPTEAAVAAGKIPAPRSDGAVDWCEAYDRLWSLRDGGLRPDYPFYEPVSWEEIEKEMSPIPALTPLSEEAYRERIAGAVCGRIAGVVLGKPLEMGLSFDEVKRFLTAVGDYPPTDYVPERCEAVGMTLREDMVPSTKGHIAYAQDDDDIDYTLLCLLLAEGVGPDFARIDVALNMIGNMPGHALYGASRVAYAKCLQFTSDCGTEEELAGIPWKYNTFRECIDGQIRGDMWGYLCPGDPKKAAYYAYRSCSYSLAKNGCYGGMFVAGCLAAALTENPTVDTILDAGLAVIPKRSCLHDAVTKVRESVAAGHDWETVCREIKARFADMSDAGTENNLSVVTLALLKGDLHYTETIGRAVAAALDTDCNGGTAGSICGAAVGRAGIDDHWIAPFHNTVRSMVAGIGSIGFDEIVDRIIAVRPRFDAASVI